MSAPSPAAPSRDRLLARARWRPWELALWALIWAMPLAFAQHAALINEIAILALFALSLDLILGYAGIVSLGHAAFFGVGAYTAGLIANHRKIPRQDALALVAQHLIPGVYRMPSGVFATCHAQQLGCGVMHAV